eukprot:9181399-Pyramimonas_sp.AAC.1
MLLREVLEGRVRPSQGLSWGPRGASRDTLGGLLGLMLGVWGPSWGSLEGFGRPLGPHGSNRGGSSIQVVSHRRLRKCVLKPSW